MVNRRLRVVLVHLAATALVACTLLLSPATAEGRSGAGFPPIGATDDVNVRVAPNLSGGILRRLPTGTSATIRCAILGQTIYDTPVWFYSEFVGSVRGFWSAYYSDANYQTLSDLQSRYGIPRCDRSSSATGGSVYYQPRYSPGDPIAPYETLTVTKDFWAAGSCSAAYSAYWAPYFDGRLITRASAWSLGRLGITYLLSEYPARAANLQQIVLFDPGSLADYRSECDLRYDQDGLMAGWLRGNSNRRLLVLAGEVTRDQDHPDAAGRWHQGIQQYLFPAIRSAGLSGRVLVCNYDTMKHDEVLRNFGSLAASGSLTACPGSPDASWRP